MSSTSSLPGKVLEGAVRGMTHHRGLPQFMTSQNSTLISDSIDDKIPQREVESRVNDADNPPEQTTVEVDMQNDADEQEEPLDDDENAEDSCSICLHHMDDRTVIPHCSHEFCFECLLIWTGQSRRCPLCNQAMGDYVIHSIRSRYDYRKHFLPPLKGSSPTPQREHQDDALRNAQQRAARRRRERRRDRDQRLDEVDRLERSITQRRWIYQHDLYAKHVGSNSYTKYRPYPTPSQFAGSPDLIARTTTFLRRELRVWEGLDVEFLTNLIISLMKSIDIRSEAAVKLLAEFLDMDPHYVASDKRVNTEHFAHEVYCYIRSPYKDLFIYDTIVQYDSPPGIQSPSETARRRRWHQRGDSPSGSPPDSREFSSSRGESSSTRRSAVDYVTDSPPRSRRRLSLSDSQNESPEIVASTSRFTLNSLVPPLPGTQAATQETTPSINPAATISAQNFPTDEGANIPASDRNPESHANANSFIPEPLDPKGKGKVALRGGPTPLIPNGNGNKVGGLGDINPPANAGSRHGAAPDATDAPNVSNGTQSVNIPTGSRPPIRRDLKSSIRSYLA